MSALSEPVGLAYVVVFGGAGVVCLWLVSRLDRIEVADTRRGMRWLLVTVGAWSLTEGGRLLVSDPTVSVWLYMLGLTAGLASVGAWLYFCSSYAGHDYHRSRPLRRLSVAGFLLVVTVKLTNPLHGAYFDGAVVAEPFVHVAVAPSTVHWVVVGAAYALSAVGFFVLFDLFTRVDRPTRGLAALVALSGLPVVANVVGAASEALLLLNYEPVGVAAFALGALFVADDAFLQVHRRARDQLLDCIDEAVVVVDAEGRIRETNDRARQLVPALGAATPRETRLETAAPDLAAARKSQEPMAFDADDTRRWLSVTEWPLTRGSETVGAALVLTDVSEVVEQREELRRQNAQLEEFAAAITHELRNALTVVDTRLDIIERADPEGVDESLAAAARSTDRATRIVDDLATLARKGQTVEATAEVDFRAAVEEAWDRTGVDVDLCVRGEGTVVADRVRMLDLLESAARFAAANGADRATVALGATGFTVADDGAPVPPGRADDLFEYGAAVPTATSGRLLPVVATLARVHGWTVAPDPGYDRGVRYRVNDVSVALADAGAGAESDTPDREAGADGGVVDSLTD